MKVSICLPTLNARCFLEPRMESILSQTEKDWELIVCDSFSDDGTWEYFQKFKGDPRVRLYQVPREGLYAGWNECLKRVKGEYVYIATADDTCDSAFLEKMIILLENEGRKQLVAKDGVSKSIDIARCQFDFIDSNGGLMKVLHEIPSNFLGEWEYRKHIMDGYLGFAICLLCGVLWTTVTAVLFRSSLLKKTGLFRTDCGVLADRYWAIKACFNSDIIYLPERLATWRIHGDQASKKMNISLKRLNLKMTEELLDEYSDRIPERWKADVRWKRKLSWLARRDYYSSFNLDRSAISGHYWLFLEGVLLGMIKEPAYLVSRCFERFSWDSEHYANQSDYLRKLIKKWEIQWPPISTAK